MPLNPTPLFELERLHFAYSRRPVLNCQRLELPAGQAIAFVGPNGSGKTTLLKLLNGLVGPYQGTVRFAGRPLPGNAELRRRSVYVHQHPVLFAGTVRSNLVYALKLKKFRGRELEERLQSAAQRLGILELLDRTAPHLSGGETQRVALARALAIGADVLLLDEPTSSMDRASDLALRDILITLKKDGLSLLFSAHDDSLVAGLADLVCLFDQGKPEPLVPAGEHYR